ncbi:unnamed protein product [Allacma fusca]|uniref:Peptidase S1 domain-containing protein n=1 Tax=Allacma fusca TaxID=39272 RepID=A0A8J2JY49_9HEXA|nr:unnamed protein product [Allacma fusca]
MNSQMTLKIFVILGVTLTLGYPTSNEETNIGINIVGGSETKPNQYPSIVDVRVNYGSVTYHSCGGSIIDDKWLVTAAHYATSTPSSYLIVAGDHNISRVEGTEQTQQVSKIIRHENYSSGTYENDIALMQVSVPFDLNQFVNVSELAPRGYVVQDSAIAIGWGRLSTGGASPETLQHVEVPFVTDVNCRNAYGQSLIYDSMICAGHPDGGKDACQGDSGGPLNHNGTMVGITSWGYGCAQASYPGVYTEVSYFHDWVKQKLADNA